MARNRSHRRRRHDWLLQKAAVKDVSAPRRVIFQFFFQISFLVGDCGFRMMIFMPKGDAELVVYHISYKYTHSHQSSIILPILQQVFLFLNLLLQPQCIIGQLHT